MKPFEEIWQRTLKRKGSIEAIESRLPTVKTEDELEGIPDDRWLAEMTRAVFRAGFSWKVIDAKWEGFEEAFEGFVPKRWAMMRDQDLSRLVKDTRIVRHEKKILSVADNASLLCELADEHGSAAFAFARWPSTSYVDLLEMIKKRGSRLGGTSGQYFIRSMGKDSVVFSRDVCAALIDAGSGGQGADLEARSQGGPGGIQSLDGRKRPTFDPPQQDPRASASMPQRRHVLLHKEGATSHARTGATWVPTNRLHDSIKNQGSSDTLIISLPSCEPSNRRLMLRGAVSRPS